MAQHGLLALCKNRGFVYPCSSIYGGLSNAYDYGPLGVQLKKNITDRWWRDFVETRSDCVGMDSSIILNPSVWHAAGHTKNFSDPMSECRSCHSRVRVDKLVTESPPEGIEPLDFYKDRLKFLDCDKCGKSDFTDPRDFNMLFQTYIGGLSDTREIAYLRPETAQGAFINFQHVAFTMRKRFPIGIAQVGKAFRNEISPSHFLFRMREFEQMELEYFCKPEDSSRHYSEWKDVCYNWLLGCGIRPSSLRLHEHASEELAHYADATTDIEFKYDFGWGELWGIANRGDFDLRQHQEHSGVKLALSDGVLPHVIEPAVGVDRLLYAILTDAYTEEAGDVTRTVMKLHHDLSPYQFAVFPLVSNKPAIVERSVGIFKRLARIARTDLDTHSNIGKRYRRHDEIGTPHCITVDFEGLDDDSVTIRERDSMKQRRISVDELLKRALDGSLNNL